MVVVGGVVVCAETVKFVKLPMLTVLEVLKLTAKTGDGHCGDGCWCSNLKLVIFNQKL